MFVKELKCCMFINYGYNCLRKQLAKIAERVSFAYSFLGIILQDLSHNSLVLHLTNHFSLLCAKLNLTSSFCGFENKMTSFISKANVLMKYFTRNG